MELRWPLGRVMIPSCHQNRGTCPDLSSPHRGDHHTVFCVCPWRRVFIFLGLVVFTFLMQQLTLWQAWSCSECAIHRCTELVLELPNPSWFSSIYSDSRLRDECHVTESPIKMNYDIKFHHKKSPDLITKCGEVTPVPLNPRHRKQHKSRNNAITQSNNLKNNGYKMTSRSDSIHEISNKHTDGITHSSTIFNVPNIVHYISIGSREFQLLNYLSFLSVQRFVQPHFIYIHGDTLPYGYWWNRTLEEVDNIHFVPREPTVRIQGYKVPWIEHSSDIIRLQTLLNNGGIYLDTDILVLKPLHPLYQYDTVLGRETSYGLGSGVIMARPNSPFVCMWMHGFRTYTPWPWHWAKYAVWTPNHLANVIPQYIHVEEETFHHPTFDQLDKMFHGHYNWSRSYTMHIWKRYGHVPNTIGEVKKLDSTLGEVMRHILYGSKELIVDI